MCKKGLGAICKNLELSQRNTGTIAMYPFFATITFEGLISPFGNSYVTYVTDSLANLFPFLGGRLIICCSTSLISSCSSRLLWRHRPPLAFQPYSRSPRDIIRPECKARPLHSLEISLIIFQGGPIRVLIDIAII